MKCPLCDITIKHARTLKRHLNKQHKDNPRLEECLKLLPKEEAVPCRICRKPQKNPARHEKMCREKLARRRQDERGEDHSTNETFIAHFKAVLQTAQFDNCRPKTVKIYVSVLKKMIRHEVSKDENFNAWDWFAWGSQSHKVLSKPADYAGLFTEGYKRQWPTVYGHLHRLVDEKRLEGQESPAEQHARRGRELEMMRKSIASGKQRQTTTSKEVEHPESAWRDQLKLDTAVTQQLLDEWHGQSKKRKKVLAGIQEGNFDFDVLKPPPGSSVRTHQKQATAFVALTVYLYNRGIRPEVVNKLTAGQVREAKAVPVTCYYCQHPVDDYKTHKKYCENRRAWLESKDGGDYPPEMLEPYEDYDSGSESGTVTHHRLRVGEHKTSRTYRHIEVIVSNAELLTIQSLIPEGSDNSFCPFKNVSWEWEMLPILENCVRGETWKAANEKRKLGAYEFKRLAVKKIFDAEVDIDRKLNAIGLDRKTAVTWYDPSTGQSAMRADDLNAAKNSGGPKLSVSGLQKRPVEQLESESDSDSYVDFLDAEENSAGPKPSCSGLQKQLDSDSDSDSDSYDEFLDAETPQQFREDRDMAEALNLDNKMDSCSSTTKQ